MKHLTTLAGVALLMSAPAFAGGHATWTSVAEASRVAFGSVKKDTVGEVHHFETVAGTVSEAGAVEITVDLGSVETDPFPGHSGRPYPRFSGIALEAQGWPNAANHSDFPSIEVTPEYRYHQHTRWTFATE